MLIAKNLQVYIKTTGTCNLNCWHCFTSGSKGEKIFFSPRDTIHYLNQLIEQNDIQSIHLVFHGGEPLLAPLTDLYLFYNLSLELPTSISFGIQTNLVYKLTPEKKEFFDKVFKTGMGTSWDPDIRFGSLVDSSKESQINLWEKNVVELAQSGHSISLMVCLSKYLIENYSPKMIIEYAISLGIKFIQFEKITFDGNTELNSSIVPSNKCSDEWILKMYHQTIQYSYDEKIGNMLLNEIFTSYLKATPIGNLCRNCEQHIITINADGSLAGCPNSATKNNWNDIQNPPMDYIRSGKRIEAISKEKIRNEICLTCDVKHICNGNCYKQKWDQDQCPAPISVMREIAAQSDKNYERFLI